MFNKLVHQVVDLGKRANSGFKKEAWKEVIVHIQKKTGHKISIDRCKNKVDTLKGYWRGFNYLKDQSGFGYNEETGLFEADDNVWGAIIKVSNNYLLYNNNTYISNSWTRGFDGTERTAFTIVINLIHFL